MTYFRLLLVDQFTHGIGGGRYDQVTDRVMAGFFEIEPPRFSVATATLFSRRRWGIGCRACPACGTRVTSCAIAFWGRRR